MIVKFGKMLCLAIVTLAFAGPTAAEQPTLQDALLDKLQGTWVITGTIAGEETTDDLAVEWVNQHQYLRLHEVSRGRRPNGRQGMRPRFTSGGISQLLNTASFGWTISAGYLTNLLGLRRK